MKNNKNNSIDLTIIILTGAFITAVGFAVTEFIDAILNVVIVLAALISVPILIIEFYTYRYFRSARFNEIKDGIRNHTFSCNELNHHIGDLKKSYLSVKQNDYGEGSIVDCSTYGYKRKEWSIIKKNRNVVNCSAIVCKNASSQPYKYLCKYFNIDVNETTMSEFEAILNDFAAAEQGKRLLENEKSDIVNGISKQIPFLISLLKKTRLEKELGFDPIDLSELYFPVFTFQYVSAGGNSSFKCDIRFDVENLEKFITYLNGLIKYKQSVAGQRMLMTSGLRERIKQRDDFTCKKCGLSTKIEKNLLLEIDHVIPISKGGLTSVENLQTLCWKCNRRKGSKIEEVSNITANQISEDVLVSV